MELQRRKPISRLPARIVIRLAIAFMVAAGLGAVPAGPARAAHTTRYVTPTGSDDLDCTSTASPCRTIQHAINVSESGDLILVAKGTYIYNVETDDLCGFLMTPAVVCTLDRSVTILGGYSGYDWSNRNPALNLTIIDGQNTYRGVAVLGYSNAIFADIEGFTIQNGLAHGPTTGSNPGAMGGGMLVQLATITLKDVIFRNNQAIGADTTSGDGGNADGAAIRIESTPDNTTAFLQRVTFDNNRSYGGSGPTRGGVAFGALFIYASSATVEDSTFTNNLAQGGSSNGSGTSKVDGLHADGVGGGIAIENCAGCSINVINLNRVTVTGNQAKGGNAGGIGGGAFGGGIIVEDTPWIAINDSYIANNTATAGNGSTAGNAAGGGIQAQNNTEINIQRTTILANTATGGNSTSGGNAGPGAGGGMYIFTTHATGSYHATLTNVIFAENLIQQGTGNTSIVNGSGAGLVVHGVNADINHATFAFNRLAPNLICGQALVVQPWGSTPASVHLNYSIIANHTEGVQGNVAIYVAPGASLVFNKGLFSGNNQDTNMNSMGMPPGTISGLSTMSTAASAGFISPSSPNHDYHILSNSSAKDKASGSTTALDIDGENRPYGPAPDYGADEYVLPALSASPNELWALVDNDDELVRLSRIGVSTGSQVDWTATTNASWLYLGSSGSNRQATGKTGEDLTIRIAPGTVGQGSYNATVTITSSGAAQTTLAVHLQKVKLVLDLYLPLIIRP